MPTPLNSPNFSSADQTGQITWNGPAIPCLNICNGDKLNKVVKIIADKVCTLAAPLDLSTLTLQCALDLFNKDEAGNRTLAKVLQLLIDNECGLKELIDNIQLQIDGITTENLVLNLSCLGISPGYTTETVLQGLINAVCENKSDINLLEGRVDNLNTTLTNHINQPVINTEVQISTCITPAATVVSQSVVQLAANYCDYKSVLGTKGQVQTAIARQTYEINELMSAVVGWIATPISEAQSVSNQWLFLKSLHDRISSIENNCCKTSCSDIKIGYNIVVSDGFISIAFSSLSGASIPSGLNDLGSTLLLTDKNGTTINYTIAIAQDATRGDYSYTGLSTDGPISVSVISVLGNDTLHCQQVTTKSFTVASTDSCCVIINNSSSNNTIVYTTSTLSA